MVPMPIFVHKTIRVRCTTIDRKFEGARQLICIFPFIINISFPSHSRTMKYLESSSFTRWKNHVLSPHKRSTRNLFLVSHDSKTLSTLIPLGTSINNLTSYYHFLSLTTEKWHSLVYRKFDIHHLISRWKMQTNDKWVATIRS